MTTQEWIDNLKVAIYDSNLDTIGDLSKKFPKFSTLNEQKEALAFMKLAIKILSKEQNKILNTMQKLKKTKKYLS